MLVQTKKIGMGGLVDDLQAAITRFENTNPAYNNPCALTAGPGATGRAPNGIALFPDLSTGRAACDRQIQLNIDRGLTLEEFFAGKPGVYPGYAPAVAGNDPANYSATVARWLGISSDVPLNAAGAAGEDWTPWLVGGVLAASAALLWVLR
jgi:hypothetical protein